MIYGTVMNLVCAGAVAESRGSTTPCDTAYPFVHVALVNLIHRADTEIIQLVLLLAGKVQNTIWRTTQQLRRLSELTQRTIGWQALNVAVAG